MKDPNPIIHPGVQGIRNTTIYDGGPGGKVFVTAHGGIGMEIHGRISIHSIEAWIAMSWRDVPEKPKGGTTPALDSSRRVIYGDRQFDTGLESSPNELLHVTQFDHSACDHRAESRDCGFDRVPEPKCHCTGTQAHSPIDDDDLPFGR